MRAVRTARAAAGWALVVIVALCAAVRPAPAKEDAPPPLARLTVTAAGGASEAARAGAERELTVALIRGECPLRLLRTGDGADPSSVDLEVEFVLTRWRERQEPGGAPVFDPLTNREKPGIVHTIEARYSVRVRAPGQEEPLAEREYRAHVVGRTERVTVDPVARARREMALEMSERVSRLVCKALRR